MTEKKKKDKEPNNTVIWDKVLHTDPNYTKEFKRGGGFSGTSINAQYNIQRATEIFGPNGKGWGVNILSEDYKPGHPLIVENGEILCCMVIHVLKVSVWYVLNGEKYETSPQFGQTTFIGSNKYGTFTDEEAPKKTMTDAMNKCLALLGFGGDIFLGMYDDNKYINDMKEQFKPKKQPLKGPLQRTALDTQIKAFVTALLRTSSVEEYNSIVEDYKTVTKQARDELPELLTKKGPENFPSVDEQAKKKLQSLKAEEDLERQQREDSEYRKDFE